MEGLKISKDEYSALQNGAFLAHASAPKGSRSLRSKKEGDFVVLRYGVTRVLAELREPPVWIAPAAQWALRFSGWGLVNRL